jgi:HK97 family phage portal protein
MTDSMKSRPQWKREQLRKDFAEKYSGLENAWKPLILEEGMDWVTIGMNAHNAEFLASRRFQISNVGRWFLVPPHMIGDVDRSTSWGTGIEQQMQGFLNFTMSYWFKLWEQDV